MMLLSDIKSDRKEIPVATEACWDEFLEWAESFRESENPDLLRFASKWFSAQVPKVVSQLWLAFTERPPASESCRTTALRLLDLLRTFGNDAVVVVWPESWKTTYGTEPVENSDP